MKNIAQKFLRYGQHYANRWWYAPLIGLGAGLDAFIIVIPTDALMISAILLCPKRWISTFLSVSIGSTLGATSLAAVIYVGGMPLVEKICPGLSQSGFWIWTESFMQNHGLWAVFVIALSPLVQHPAIALAGLVKLPLLKVALAVFCGRAIKYCLLGWIASHAPKLLHRLWGLSELKEVKDALPKF